MFWKISRYREVDNFIYKCVTVCQINVSLTCLANKIITISLTTITIQYKNTKAYNKQLLVHYFPLKNPQGDIIKRRTQMNPNNPGQNRADPDGPEKLSAPLRDKMKSINNPRDLPSRIFFPWKKLIPLIS